MFVMDLFVIGFLNHLFLGLSSSRKVRSKLLLIKIPYLETPGSLKFLRELLHPGGGEHADGILRIKEAGFLREPSRTHVGGRRQGVKRNPLGGRNRKKLGKI